MKPLKRRTFLKVIGAMAVAPVFGKIEIAESFLIPPDVDGDKILRSFYEASIISKVSTTEGFAGSIKNIGDSIIVRKIPEIKIIPYTGQSLQYEAPLPEKVKLNIDQGKKFKLEGTIKDKTLASESVGIELARHVDAEVFAKILQAVPDSNKGNSAGVYLSALRLGTKSRPVTINKNNILDAIIDMGTTLDENSIQRGFGRWVALPSCLLKNIKRADLKTASVDGKDRNGWLGFIDDMAIYKSDHIPVIQTGRKPVWCIPFGHERAFAFACNVDKRRLLYGSKVLDKKALGVYHARAGK